MPGSPVTGLADDSSATRTPRSLIDRARVADPTAWAALVDLYGPLVLRWCRRWHLQGSDAADVLQDVFLAVSTHSRRLSTGSDEPYVSRLAARHRSEQS